MKTLVTLFALTLIIVVTCTSCQGARNPDAQNGNENGQSSNTADPDMPPFEELYKLALQEDDEYSPKAKSVISKNIDLFMDDLIAKASLLDPKESPLAISLLKNVESEKVDEIILRALESESRAIVIAGINGVEARDIESALDQILEFSHSDDNGIRGNAASALASYPEYEPGIERLRKLIYDEEPGVRMAAYNGIGKAGDSNSSKELYDALLRESDFAMSGDTEGQFLFFILSSTFKSVIAEDDCDWIRDGLSPDKSLPVRVVIIESVAKLGCLSSIDHLISIAKDKDEDGQLRFRAGYALAHLGDPRGYEVSSDIYFAADNGALGVDDTNFQSFSSVMIEYRVKLDEMEKMLEK